MSARRLTQSILDSIPSRAAKNERARQMNMEGGYFHGTNADITSFNPSMRGASTDARSARKAFWVTDDPVTASGYAEHAATYAPVQKLIRDAEKAERAGNFDLYEKKIIEAEDLDAAISKDNLAVGGQNILPLRVNANLKTVDMKGASFNDEGVSEIIDSNLNSAMADGFAGVKFLNLDDAAGMTNRPATHVAIFDPKDIRSEFAEFNPARSSSSDILASAAPVAAGGILGALGLPENATAADIVFAERPELSEQGQRDAQALVLETLMGFFAPTQLAGQEAQMMPMSQQMRGQ
jgi:hypothetical protein